MANCITWDTHSKCQEVAHFADLTRGFPIITSVYTYIHFYPRTLSALPHDCLPTLEPGTRSRISARFMAPGDETPRARQGCAPRAGSCSQRPSGNVRAEPLRLEGSPETLGFPPSGAGPSQNGTCLECGIGRKIGAGRSTVVYFRFGRTRVCITPISLHREKMIGSLRFFGKRTAASNRGSSRIIHVLCYIFALLFSLACYVVVTHIRGRVARPSAPLPTTCYGRGNSPQSRYFVFFFILEEF